MKISIGYFFCIIVSSHLYAAKNITICGKISSKDTLLIQIFEPINGYYNQASVNINSNTVKVIRDSFFYSFNPLDNAPCFFDINIVTTTDLFIGRINFLLCPGDSTYILINPSIKDFNWVKFSGDNAEGNNLFLKINYMPVEKFSDLFVLIRKIPDQKQDLLKNIDENIKRFTSQFELLYDKKEITGPYFESMKKTFRMIFYSIIIDQFIFPSSVANETSKNFRDSVVQILYQLLRPTDADIKPLYNSFIYISNYYLYKVYIEKKMSSAGVLSNMDSLVNIKGKNYSINGTFFPFLFIKDLKIREDLWAIQIFAYFQLAPGFFGEDIVNEFNAMFPNSRYSKLIKEDFLITSNIKKIEYTAQTPIIFADTLITFRSLNSILSKFKNRPVYVDLWASWCVPCIAAFAYNKSVDSFLLANNIERLYISFDYNYAKWHKAVYKYQLGGYHVLANPFLINNLNKILEIKKGSTIGIPHYLIYDKSVKMIFQDAASPINKDQLFNELKAALKAKGN